MAVATWTLMPTKVSNFGSRLDTSQARLGIGCHLLGLAERRIRMNMHTRTHARMAPHTGPQHVKCNKTELFHKCA